MGNHQINNCCSNQIESPVFLNRSLLDLTTDNFFLKPTSYRIIAGQIQSDDQNNTQYSKYFHKQYVVIKQQQLLKYIKQINPMTIDIIQKHNICLSSQWYLLNTGIYYYGSLVNGIPSGIGQYFSKNGNFYQGQIINGQAIRRGIYINKEGYIYFGDFNKNKFDGYGILKNDRLKIQGQWRNGIFKKGQISQEDRKLVGQFENNLIQGFGKLICRSFIYEGEWKKGKKNGFGRIYKNNYVLISNWKQNQLMSQYKICKIEKQFKQQIHN